MAKKRTFWQQLAHVISQRRVWATLVGVAAFVFSAFGVTMEYDSLELTELLTAAGQALGPYTSLAVPVVNHKTQEIGRILLLIGAFVLMAYLLAYMIQTSEISMLL
jgi:hypothetical protein